MIRIVSMTLKTGEKYRELTYEGTLKKFCEEKSNYDGWIELEAYDGHTLFVAVSAIEKLEFVDLGDDGYECECDECFCSDCADELDEFFPDFVDEEYGEVDRDAVYDAVKSEFKAMGVSLVHCTTAAEMITNIANTMFGHYNAYAPGLTTEAENEIILEAIGLAAEILEDYDKEHQIIDEYFIAAVKDRITAGCISSLVTDFI